MNQNKSANKNHYVSLPVILAVLAVAISLAALYLSLSEPSKSAGPDGWLTGNANEKFDTLAKQQRGLDQAMWEIGYRFRELAWAGEKQDWTYAVYQVEKIRLTLEQGVARRPKRAANAQLFLEEGVAPMLRALEQNPSENFPDAMQQFTTACLVCHAREQAPLMNLNAWALQGPSQPKAPSTPPEQ